MGLLQACPDCDLLLDIPALADKQVAACPRCHARLTTGRKRLSWLLALNLTGLVLWFSSMVLPVLSIRTASGEVETSLWQSPLSLLDQDAIFLALLVTATTLIAPLIQLVSMLWLVLPVCWFKRRPWVLGWVFRAMHFNREWLMLEVFFISLIVTSVKLHDMAEVIPSWSTFALLALMMVITASAAVFDVDEYWQAVEVCR